MVRLMNRLILRKKRLLSPKLMKKSVDVAVMEAAMEAAPAAVKSVPVAVKSVPAAVMEAVMEAAPVAVKNLPAAAVLRLELSLMLEFKTLLSLRLMKKRKTLL